MSLVLGHYQSHSSCVFSIIGGVCPWFLGAVPGSPHLCFLRNHWGFVSGFGAVPVSPQLCFVRNCWGLSLFFFFSFLGQYQAHPSSVAGADTDPAAALPTAPGGSAAAPGAEANPTGPKGPGPRAEPGGKRLP